MENEDKEFKWVHKDKRSELIKSILTLMKVANDNALELKEVRVDDYYRLSSSNSRSVSVSGYKDDSINIFGVIVSCK